MNIIATKMIEADIKKILKKTLFTDNSMCIVQLGSGESLISTQIPQLKEMLLKNESFYNKEMNKADINDIIRNLDYSITGNKDLFPF